ncbi:MAG: hypothetical protein H7647_00355, partial [Candidatus Heimdallarchaeota archaeon]|nr:hypothetical protein [Candidatus Heimdallarchaeota archaeon]MCK4252885.1 hypothetical protein [Candidatus Heimdallarchaeota archaeon]
MSIKEPQTEPQAEPEESGKKWSYWGIGLLFFLVFFVALMFILEAAMQPRESFTSTLIAYILGIIGLAIFAGLVRDKSRVLISIPLLLIIVFGAGYLFNYVIEAPVYNPFAPVSERAVLILDTFEEMEATLTEMGIPADLNMEDVRFFSQFAFVIDLIIALPLFIFGTLALTWTVQVFTIRPTLWTILWAFFIIVFFFIGLILTPFIHLLFSGVIAVTSDILPGALYLGQGFSIFANFENATQEDMDEAIASFYLASEYFQQSADNLYGLQQAGLVGISAAIPVLGTFIENIYYVALAALHIASGLGPFANGTFFVLEGMEDAMASFGEGGSFLRTKDGTVTQIESEINDTRFEEGIEKVNEGLLILGNSTDYIDDALAELNKVNVTDIAVATAELEDYGVPPEIAASILEQVGMIDSYLSIFEGAVRVIDVLLTKPSGSDSATLTHFLYGAYSLFKAGDVIGTPTTFYNETEGIDTSSYFDDASANFSIVYNELLDPEVQAIANSDTPILNSTVAFLTDMVGLTVPLCSLGGNIATVLFTMQDTMSVFDVTNYEDISDYSPLISSMDDLRTTTSEMADDANATDTQINGVRAKASNDTYGELSAPALSFTDQLIQFNLTQNVYNANNIANSFYYMFSGLSHLSYSFSNITAGYVEFNNSNYVPPLDPNAQDHFIAANTSLHASISDLTTATYYMNQTENGGMTQLSGTRDALLGIRNSLYDTLD